MTPSSVSILDSVLTDLIEHCGASGSHEIRTAREDFDKRRGKVFEDEQLWERWSKAFLEWYVLERPSTHDQCLPVVLALKKQTDSVRVEALKAWFASHRSLFEILSLKEGRAELLDILGGAHFSVSEKRVLHGVRPKDILEARLVGFADEIHFGRTFCFHPRDCQHEILHIANTQKQKGVAHSAILDQLASLRVRCVRYKHLKPQRIYKEYADRS